VAPTGAGKTVLMAETARRSLARGERVVAVCHREEIAEQIISAFTHHLGRRTFIDVIRSGSRSRMNAPVTVGMVPTMSRRLERLGALQGATLLMDEAHHAGSNSWDDVTQAIAPGLRCGFTATPIRPNGQGLGDQGGFTRLHVGPHPAELMAMGHLCRYRMFAAEVEVAGRGLSRRSGGDYKTRDLEAAKSAAGINGEIVRDWLRYNPQRLRTIAVGVSVDDCHAMAKRYQASGIAAEVVDGKTPKGIRKAIFQRFREGVTTILCACAVVDEGLDVPEATVLQLTRATHSIRLYRQLCGRVLRTAPGKGMAIIIDHTDNWKRLPPPDYPIEWELFMKRAEQKPGSTQINPVSREVEITADQLVADDDNDGVWENGVELVEVTSSMLFNSRPHIARRLLNDRLASELAAVGSGGRQAASLKPWLQRTQVLSDELIHGLGAALNMPPGWAAGQVMLNMMQSQQQVTAATKRLQGGVL
jgi:DNA repair protein RadD